MTPELRAALIEKAKREKARRKQTFMGNLNTGIAESAGGAIDFLNPFDKPHALNPFPEGTGSAVDGMTGAMNAAGVNTVDGPPSNPLMAFGRGVGNAAGAAPLIGGGAALATQLPGMAGRVAQPISAGLNTARGTAAELVAGGGAAAGESIARDAGAGPTGQAIAGVVGGLTPGAAAYWATKGPLAQAIRGADRGIKAIAMPYTQSGGMEVARRRVQDLSGGPERAAELARTIAPDGGDLNLTPAQQTGDQNLVALEQAAAELVPTLRARLEGRRATANTAAQDQIRGMGGDVSDAQTFFADRITEYKGRLQGQIKAAMDRAEAARPRASRSDSENSQVVYDEILKAERAALDEENRLWEAVPKGVQVGTTGLRQAVNEIITTTPRAKQKHIPADLRGVEEMGDMETVAEMHALYSELRRVAREAMARPVPNKAQASMANRAAQAILDDLGAGAGDTDVGRTIDAARAWSAQMHETFDRGEVGRLLKRSIDGGEKIDPRLTLDQTVGRTGARGEVGLDDVTRAADSEATEIATEDYMRGMFDRRVFPDEQFAPRAAGTFMRDRAGVLKQMPQLRDAFDNSISQAQNASRIDTRNSSLLDLGQSRTQSFVDSEEYAAGAAIFKDRNPSIAARTLANTARKDASGRALLGVKGGVLDHVLTAARSGDDLSGEAFRKSLRDPKTRAVFAQIFDAEEIKRLDQIGRELSLSQDAAKPKPSVGTVANTPANKIITIIARIAAARKAAQAGGSMAGGLQAAQIASGNAAEAVSRLTSDKATQILVAAVEDPILFRALLLEPDKIDAMPAVKSLLAPYIAGLSSVVATDQPGMLDALAQ